MQETVLFNILKSTGLPVVYHHFEASENNPPPKPPYIVYLFAYSDNFAADNCVYSKANNYQVELYTIKKEPATEKLVEDAMDGAEIFWDKSETYIESEKLYQVLYEIQI